MKPKYLFQLLAIGTALAFPCTGFTKQHEALTDDTFAKKAAIGGLTEVALGQIAEQNGDSQGVKDFGAKMVTDHGKVNDNLKALAQKDNLTIPDKPDADHQAIIDKLTKETGAAFDKSYIHLMVRAHKGDKALFEEEIASAKNPDLKQFATDTLPIIKEHLGMIEEMANNPHHDMAATMTGNEGKNAPAPPEAATSPATAPAATDQSMPAGTPGAAPAASP